MKTHIALLRGINVGGNNLVKMAELRAFMESLGLGEVETLLQSGNVVFCSHDKTEKELEDLLEAGAKDYLGVSPAFMVRSAAHWSRIIAQNPFPNEAETDPGRLILFAMKDAPATETVEAIQAAVKGRERMVGIGRELYVVYPDGQGNSKIGSTPGWNKLVASGTGRNWNTVLKLLGAVKQAQ